MKFDIEGAKKGEPIEYQEAFGWIAVRFIGMWDSESAVCAVDWSYKPEIVLISKLRMAKKKEVVRVKLALKGSYRGYYTISVDDEEYAKQNEEDYNFIKWITDWQEYEIGANDE